MADTAPADTIARRGFMLVLSSPSGAGKSTLTRALLKPGSGLELSISVTTRARRHSEIEDVHYRFIDQKRFDRMRDAGELLEWAEVHGNCYATPREPVEAALAAGRDVLFDIDWQGTRQLAEKMADDLARVFILPPSMAELRARLDRRAEDPPEVIARRLAAARDEIAHWDEYDYVLVNDDLQRSLEAVQAIIAAERLKRARQPGLPAFVDGLLSEP
ncbi:MAG: guanylate kinase [Bauldia sp.]|nr:guanylate kinase [Bauldia sp.]